MKQEHRKALWMMNYFFFLSEILNTFNVFRDMNIALWVEWRHDFLTQNYCLLCGFVYRKSLIYFSNEVPLHEKHKNVAKKL